MVAKRRVVEVEPDSELARLLDDPAELPIDLIKDGVLYQLDRKDARDAMNHYDPERARQAFDRAVGAWAEVDADALIEMLYRARIEGSRPVDRPGPLDPD